MERILDRPLLKVCSKCFNLLDQISAASRKMRPLSSQLSVFHRNRSPIMTVTSRYFMFYTSQSQPRSLGPQCFIDTSNLSISKLDKLFPVNHSQIRNFATDASESSKELPPKKKIDKGNEFSPLSWKSVITMCIFGGVLLFGMKYYKTIKEKERKKKQNKSYGKARLGGDWTLTDHNGKVRSSTDYRGQWMLLYFGFTNCPDVCPEEMEKLVNVIKMCDADPKLPTIQPIMITVDPLRDTPEALKEYLAEFSPRFLGCSGTEEQIERATRAFRVYYSAGPKDDDNDYIVDHSIISYLVNPDGEFAEYFGQTKKTEEIFNETKKHISKYEKKKAK